MTTERDFDRLARAWLELAPDEAPDRVIAAVLQAVETTPQVRPSRWSLWRSVPMTRLPIIAAVAATLVVVIGGAVLLQRSNDRGIRRSGIVPRVPPGDVGC
jgi:anti-sigma-K factor RskA